MKIKKRQRKHCPHCNKHQEVRVFQVKKGKSSSLSRGSKYRARKRGLARGAGSQGRYSRPAVTKFKMTGKKVSKKTDIKYECTECKKFFLQRQGTRAKRVELI